MAGVAERTLALKLIGDVSGLRKDLKPAQRQIGQFTKGLASWGKALAGGVLIGGVERLAGSLRDAWDGYRSGEKAAGQLRRTWKNLGLEGKRYRGVLDKVTASTLALGTSDDEAVEAFSRSLSRTRDYKQSLRELAIAQDLVASGAATNLESAFRIIQQAGKGSARVVDRFGLDSKTAAGRIRELGRQVEGTARTKAKLDPLGVLFNRMGEDVEGIVGAFAKGNFKGVLQGIQGLGETVADALFGGKGSDNIRNSKKAGLVNQFGAWGNTIATSIRDEFGKVDWGKTLQDTLNSALGALKTAIDNGTLGNLAVVGAALAGAIFAVDLFVTAATTMFGLPKMAGKAIVAVAAKALGKAFAAAMFIANFFVTEAARIIGDLGTDAKLTGRAKSSGRKLGRITGAGMALGIVTAIGAGIGLSVIVNAVLDALGVPQDGTGGIKDRTRRIVEDLKNNTGTGGANSKGRKTGFASGLWKVPGDMVANVHKGEMIVPEFHAERLRSGGTGGSNYSISVYVAPGGDMVEAGRQMVRAIREYEKRGGASWRN